MDLQAREPYRECMRNHAATLGTYATDGCGEYAADPSSPGGLHCAACGCHRNFHRKVTPSTAASPESTHVGGPDSPIALGPAGAAYDPYHYASSPSRSADGLYRGSAGVDQLGGKRRSRTKFTAEQKEQMLRFADKIGWRIPRGDTTDEVGRFCREIGVPRQVFKVWMHNHKNGGGGGSGSGSGVGGTAGGLGGGASGGLGGGPALSSSTTSIPLPTGAATHSSALEANASSSLTQ